MKVIGVAGQKQNGKDTTADRIMLNFVNSNQAWKRTAFALKVKQIFCDTFNVDMDFIEKWKVIPEPPPGFDMPVRESLQFIGDGFREIQPRVWLDQPFRDKSVPLIISDVRYVNEFTQVNSEGGYNILVIKPDRINYDENGSEKQIRPYVTWFLDYIDYDKNQQSAYVYCVDRVDWKSQRKTLKPEPPEGFELFNLVILNSGSVQDLQNLVDERVMSLISDFKFN
jgi:hypothetical protein